MYISEANKKMRPKIIPLDVDAKCLICGISKPLDRCHIIPKRLFFKIPSINKHLFIDYDGINTFILCKNHHTLYDNGQLTKEEFAQIYIEVLNILVSLQKHTVEMMVKKHIFPPAYFTDLITFISSFTIYGKENKT